MRYQLKQIYCRPWTLSGLSLKLLESHYENNYGGALRRLNAITEQLESLDFAKTPGYVINGLKREELVALNSTLLHELYFASLGGDGRVTNAMSEALARDFGSVQRWRTEFFRDGLRARRRFGLGGSVLDAARRPAHQSICERAQPGDRRAASLWSRSTCTSTPTTSISARTRRPTSTRSCAMSTGRPSRAVRGRSKVAPPRPLVQDEFRDVPGVGVEEVRAMLAEGKPLQLIDTRPKHFVSRQQDIAEGVTWRDPDRVGEWMGELSKEKPVVVYCAYGFHVGCRTAIALRDAGFDARYMTVGHSGWKAVGAPVKMNA
jgi:Fe-Mn family superoxide dismutase